VCCYIGFKRNWKLINLCPCQHDNSYMDGRLQIKVHTDKRTQVHSAQSSLSVTNQSTNLARRYLTSVTESPSKHWSPLRTANKRSVLNLDCVFLVKYADTDDSFFSKVH